MKINLTIGTIWQDQRTQKYYELSAINKETGKIQLSSVDNEQTFTCMTENSLHKNYKLIAMSMKEFRPETVTTVVTQAKDEVIPEHVEVKSVKTEEKPQKVSKGAGLVELPDGKIITGRTYFTDYLKIDFKSIANGETSPIYFLNRKSQSQLLEKFNAKVVYGKEVTV